MHSRKKIPESNTTAGYITIVGATNVGKSTLLNKIVGSKLSIVTPKVQTTRASVLGIYNFNLSQMIFIDTPGIIEPKSSLDRSMMKSAWNRLGDTDLVLLTIDSSKKFNEENNIYNFRILSFLKNKKAKLAIVVNKIDKINKNSLLILVDNIKIKYGIDDIFLISALSGDGLSELIFWISSNLPSSPWFYPSTHKHEMSIQYLAAEITREKLFLLLHQELPYSLTVETEKLEEKNDKSLLIHQVIYIKKESQKIIVLGSGGKKIKEIGILSRESLQNIFKCKVHLKLFVKVRSNWQEDAERYKVIGLDYIK